jgi:hypothetical protein
LWHKKEKKEKKKKKKKEKEREDLVVRAIAVAWQVSGTMH